MRRLPNWSSLAIFAEDRDFQVEGLSRDHAVDGVAVAGGKPSDAQGGGGLNRQQRVPCLRQRRFETGFELLGFGELSKAHSGGNLPRRGCGYHLTQNCVGVLVLV